MWFNRGSGGSPVRLNRLPHGFTPASLRCLCTMDPESLGKALQDCLRALGTGQGADPPAAPAPQAAAAPPAPHLVWRGFRGPRRWSQRRTRSALLLQGPGGVATRLVRRIGGPAVHGDSEQHAGYGRHHLRWGKAQEGQGKRRDGSSGATGNGTIVQPSVVQAIQGVQQVCSSSAVVSAGSTVRLNCLHRLQPCTFERHLPTH